jgi:hypothetical protein
MADETLKGGEKVAAYLKTVADKVSRPATLRVGFLSGATYPDGTPVAMIAAIDEFGAPSRGQPSRPFFRDMIAAKGPEWPEAIANLLKANNYDLHATLQQAGEAIAGQLRQSITNFNGAALAPSTIKKKGFDKQLVDTVQMLNSVDYEVTEG